MKTGYFIIILMISVGLNAQEDLGKLVGHWQGIDMFQDEESYDGKTYYLPNKGEMVISQTSINTYFYPYSKTSESNTKRKGNTIYFTINGGQTTADFSFLGDTLVLSMFFIGKKFVKMFERIEMDQRILDDLDQHGFRPASLEHRYELDTFRNNMKSGFPSYDSLAFKPFTHLQFVGNDKIRINDSDPIRIERSYNEFSFDYNSKKYNYLLGQANGTQTITLIPSSQCACDSIVLPYMTVSWADRIRQAIIDYKNF